MLCHFQIENWDMMPDDKTVFSAYTRASGQEWFFTDISKAVIEDIIRVRE